VVVEVLSVIVSSVSFDHCLLFYVKSVWFALCGLLVVLVVVAAGKWQLLFDDKQKACNSFFCSEKIREAFGLCTN